MHWFKKEFNKCLWTACFLVPDKATKDHCQRQRAIAVPVKPVTREVQGGWE